MGGATPGYEAVSIDLWRDFVGLLFASGHAAALYSLAGKTSHKRSPGAMHVLVSVHNLPPLLLRMLPSRRPLCMAWGRLGQPGFRHRQKLGAPGRRGRQGCGHGVTRPRQQRPGRMGQRGNPSMGTVGDRSNLSRSSSSSNDSRCVIDARGAVVCAQLGGLCGSVFVASRGLNYGIWHVSMRYLRLLSHIGFGTLSARRFLRFCLLTLLSLFPRQR